MFVILVTMEKVVVNVGDITRYQNFMLPSVLLYLRMLFPWSRLTMLVNLGSDIETHPPFYFDHNIPCCHQISISFDFCPSVRQNWLLRLALELLHSIFENCEVWKRSKIYYCTNYVLLHLIDFKLTLACLRTFNCIDMRFISFGCWYFETQMGCTAMYTVRRL